MRGRRQTRAGSRADARGGRRRATALAVDGQARRSVLLVDVGNTRVKWARFDGRRLGRQHAAPFAGWTARDFARELFGSVGRRFDRVLVSSVAGSRVNRMLTDAVRLANGPKLEFVATQRHAGGVTTAYVEPWRLGVDRFVMAIGAHRLAGRRPVCIISVGTALTIDLVDAHGLHRGGAILPAPSLMVESLLSKTNGIRRRAAPGGRRSTTGGRSRHLSSGSRGIFARTTREAVEQGALFAAAAAIDRGAAEAQRAIGGGAAPLVLVTGGGAKSVAPLIRRPYEAVPDLVLRGLAVLASEGRPPSRDS